MASGLTYLGAQYRRLRTKLGAPKAITAMAHRLARLVYRMLDERVSIAVDGTQLDERAADSALAAGNRPRNSNDKRHRRPPFSDSPSNMTELPPARKIASIDNRRRRAYRRCILNPIAD